MNVAGNDAPASSRTCARRSISSLASLSFSADRRAISGGSASISLCMACTAPSRARTDCRNTHQLSRRALADVRTCCFARILACSRSAYRTDTSQCPRHQYTGMNGRKSLLSELLPSPQGTTGRNECTSGAPVEATDSRFDGAMIDSRFDPLDGISVSRSFGPATAIDSRFDPGIAVESRLDPSADDIVDTRFRMLMLLGAFANAAMVSIVIDALAGPRAFEGPGDIAAALFEGRLPRSWRVSGSAGMLPSVPCDDLAGRMLSRRRGAEACDVAADDRLRYDCCARSCSGSWWSGQ